jgi:glycyl-tRNA synthetase beta chain
MTDTCTFLVEIGTEELPPKALRSLSAAFSQGVVNGIAAAGLHHGAMESFATPRRLAVKVLGLQSHQIDQEIVVRGPPVKVAFDQNGQATRAAQAFAEKNGVSVEDLGREQTDKGEWLMYRGLEQGKPAAQLLPGIVQASLDALPIPKRMRWGDGDAEFVRPVHWVVMLMDGDIVPGSLLGIAAGRLTYGHRFHAPGGISLDSASEYPAILEQEGCVIADFDRRRARIEDLAREAASAVAAQPVSDDALYDEVCALVEWPVPVRGGIDQRFLELPREVLIATLQGHQRYFPLQDADGALLPEFVTISNIESRQPEQVRLGNERVVRPRLADAEFFWRADRKHPLADNRDKLDAIVFQQDLGSLGDKTCRVEQLAVEIAKTLGVQQSLVQRAAMLAKCDLASSMVGEFPELQGTMGRYYALADGEPEPVAAALEEQYLPRHAGDALPAGAVGQVLAVADRVDTLCGIFAIGQRPSGSRDPFGLRRGALGLVRILIEHRLDLDLPAVISRGLAMQPVAALGQGLDSEVYQYVMDRLKAYYLEESGAGFSAEMFAAVMAKRPSSPLDFDQRLRAVLAFSGMPEADSLAAANKRVANILKKCEEPVGETVNPSLFQLAEEAALQDRMEILRSQVRPLLQQRDYTAALALLAQLREPVDAFFEKVMVMDPDPDLRANRLALLGKMRELFLYSADLSLLKSGE